ncbi:MAG: hypothetical protein K0S22_1670 [Oscillospiraceae bacterium]|jgi:uncharacterized protein YbbK (DUF523 family)|nr:hypothetical protein [Oscillospiraceae bacterium]
MNILVSACLMGLNCRYDGSGYYQPKLEKLKNKYHLIPICPEIYGGLTTPREPAEIQGNKVMTKSGCDVTAQYEKGAQETLALARMMDCRIAVLKAKSPSCGKGKIYDGSFCGKLINGNGVVARLLINQGLTVLTEEDIETLI